MVVKVIEKLVPAGQASITFNDSECDDTMIYDVFVNDLQLFPTDVRVSEHTVTINFKESSLDNLYVKIVVNALEGSLDASDIPYDSTDTSLTSDNVEDAIDELDNNISANVADIEQLQLDVVAVQNQVDNLNAADIPFDNTLSGMISDDVQGAIEEVFQSVSNGKELIASAITDKGIPTLATDTFETMAENIEAIEGGGGSGYIGLKATNYNKNQFVTFKGSGTTAQALATIEDNRVSIYNNQSYLQYRWIDLVGFYVDIDLTDIEYISFRTNRTNNAGRMYSFALNTKPELITSGSTISTGSGTYGLIQYPTDAAATTNFTLDVRGITGHRYVGLASIATTNTTYCTRFYGYKD